MCVFVRGFCFVLFFIVVSLLFSSLYVLLVKKEKERKISIKNNVVPVLLFLQESLPAQVTGRQGGNVRHGGGSGRRTRQVNAGTVLFVTARDGVIAE